MTKKKVTMKKSNTKRIAADSIDIVFSSYVVKGSNKLGACVKINHCVIELTDPVFSSFNEVLKYINEVRKNISLSPVFERMIKIENEDSIEYQDRQAQLMKFNLK